nr:hypothetical protein [Tanacetum cinerariifolium]
MGDFGNGYRQKDKIKTKPDKIELEMESVKKSKVNQSQQKVKPVKVNVKDRAEAKELLNEPARTHLMGRFWSTTKAKTINGEAQIHAKADGKKIFVTESFVRRDLRLADEEGFFQIFLDQQLEGVPTHKSKFSAPSHTKKIFRNMRRIGKGFSSRVTPLFPTMVVQNQAKIGKGSGMPTNPHHTPTILQPLLSQLQKTQKPSKPKRKNTKVPQPSGSTNIVANEAVYKELRDRLVRAATAASSLEAEQDSGNIDKTQSKETPNKSSSQGTDSGCSPRVLELEKTKTSQHNGIDSLKRRVKKLKKRNKSRTHKLKRLYKVGLTARVETSDSEESLGEDASKQRRRIDAIYANKDITLGNVQDDAEMFNVDDLGEEPVKLKKKEQIRLDEEAALRLQAEFDEEERLVRERAQKEQEANIALIETWNDVQAKIDVDYQLAKRLQAEKQEELSDAEKATLFMQLLEKRRKHFAAKKAEKKRNKPPTQAQQRKIMCTYLKNMKGYTLKQLKSFDFDKIQEMFDTSFKRVNTFKDFRTELVQGKENFDKEDLVDLYKLVKAKFKSTRPVEDLNLLLWGDLKTMFEPHVEDEVWKRQQGYKVLEYKLYDSCGVHSLRMQSMHVYMLVEKTYPLTPPTLTMMLDKKLQIDYQSEIAYQLLKLILKQLKK